MENSLNNTAGLVPEHEDPDALTKSVSDLKGKGKAQEDDVMDLDGPEESNGTLEETGNSAFSKISTSNPHTEPAANPATVTRIQFRYSGGRVIRRFALADPVRRIFEWLKSEPLAGFESKEFELLSSGKNLIERLDETIDEAGLKNQTVMVEFLD